MCIIINLVNVFGGILFGLALLIIFGSPLLLPKEDDRFSQLLDLFGLLLYYSFAALLVGVHWLDIYHFFLRIAGGIFH